MSDDLILLDRRDDNVAVITLNNGKVNALSQALLGRLAEVVDELTADLPGAVVITGGEKIFAAGADISEFAGPSEAAGIADGFHLALDAVANLPRFVIAAISGFALGGGCELALACDYRIGSERATLGQPEILLGIIPGGGGTQRLPRVIGASAAKEIMLTGRQVKADEALRLGLLDEVVPGDQLHDRALSLASTIARGAVLAGASIIKVVDDGLDRPIGEALADEKHAFAEIFHTADSQIGIQSFRDNGPGKAVFTGQ